jgi:hypothetical protein
LRRGATDGSHENKEKQRTADYQMKGQDPTAPRFQLKPVAYYYIDYREFANVTKYRLAMMRSTIEDKLLQVRRATYMAHAGRRAERIHLPALSKEIRPPRPVASILGQHQHLHLRRRPDRAGGEHGH